MPAPTVKSWSIPSASSTIRKRGEVIKNQNHWNIVLRQEPGLRASMDDVKNLELISPDKRSVKLDDVAHVYKKEISNLILRDNTMRKGHKTASTSSMHAYLPLNMQHICRDRMTIQTRRIPLRHIYSSQEQTDTAMAQLRERLNGPIEVSGFY